MLLDQLRPQFAWLEAMLIDGRAYLCGEHPTLVDCSAHHLCWFVSANVSNTTPPLGEARRRQSQRRGMGWAGPVTKHGQAAGQRRRGALG